ncbi:MAG: hypothetical protein ACR2HN_13185 [Tepidiformaceae bacterium]
MPASEQVQKYYDALLASYDVLVDAVTKANERGLKVAQQLASDVARGQREAIELGKRFASEPTDFGQYYTAVLEATTAAQGRALAFTQAAYQEAVGAGSDTRESIKKLVEVNQETTRAAVEVFRNFAASNPMADAVRRGFEAMTPAAGKTRTEKAVHATNETAKAAAKATKETAAAVHKATKQTAAV